MRTELQTYASYTANTSVGGATYVDDWIDVAGQYVSARPGSCVLSGHGRGVIR